MEKTTDLQITSIEDLHTAMRQVKQRIKQRENDLGQRWNRLPEEAVKGSVAYILPAFMGNQVASGVWKLLKGAYDLFKTKSASGSEGYVDNGWKDTLVAGAKKLGLFGMAKMLFNFLGR